MHGDGAGELSEVAWLICSNLASDLAPAQFNNRITNLYVTH
jgi:hypothetical protein